MPVSTSFVVVVVVVVYEALTAICFTVKPLEIILWEKSSGSQSKGKNVLDHKWKKEGRFCVCLY